MREHPGVFILVLRFIITVYIASLREMWICILAFTLTFPCMCRGSIKERNASRVITLATLIPADELRLFSIRRVEPAMEIAIETVKKEAILNASTDLVLKFKDSKCDIADGINEAINFYVEKCSQNHELHVIFGPCCDYTAAPVGRQVRYWNIPMITPGAMAREFGLLKSNVFSHVTRVGPNFNSLVNFVVSLLDFYKWGKVNLIYEPEGHTEILKRYCHIAVDGLHYGLRSQANIPRLEQIYYKFENVTEALQNLPKWIGRSTANIRKSTPTTTVEDIDDGDDMPLSELIDLIRSLPTQAEMFAEECVQIVDIEETGKQLNDDDTLTMVSRDEVPDNANEEDHYATTDPEGKDITINQAKDRTATLISYF